MLTCCMMMTMLYTGSDLIKLLQPNTRGSPHFFYCSIQIATLGNCFIYLFSLKQSAALKVKGQKRSFEMNKINIILSDALADCCCASQRHQTTTTAALQQVAGAATGRGRLFSF